MEYPDDYLSGYDTACHCDSCMFVSDVTDRARIEELSRYHKNFDVERSLERSVSISANGPPRQPFRGLFFVIATKIGASDWRSSIQEGEDSSATIGAVFLQMSAKTEKGIGPDVLPDFASLILLRRIQNGSDDDFQETFRQKKPAIPRRDTLWDDLRSSLEAILGNHRTA